MLPVHTFRGCQTSNSFETEHTKEQGQRDAGSSPSLWVNQSLGVKIQGRICLLGTATTGLVCAPFPA